MALVSALVDRGRIIRRRRTGTKIEGTTQRIDETSEWFRMRLAPAQSEEAAQEGRTRRTNKAPVTLIDRRDLKGQLVVILGQNLIEVRSRELGNGVYQIVGDPTPLRKRHRVIGYEAQLAQVE